jgi:membrane protease subunit (stomatin/prohibitin family)
MSAAYSIRSSIGGIGSSGGSSSKQQQQQQQQQAEEAAAAAFAARLEQLAFFKEKFK